VSASLLKRISLRNRTAGQDWRIGVPSTILIVQVRPGSRFAGHPRQEGDTCPNLFKAFGAYWFQNSAEMKKKEIPPEIRRFMLTSPGD
jgi:hypothetical protein